MKHEIIATRMEHIAMATGIIAGLTAFAATLATPTGLTAFGVWMGLVDEPLIVTVAPYLDKLATASGTISGFTYFYAVKKKRKAEKPPAPSHPEQSE